MRQKMPRKTPEIESFIRDLTGEFPGSSLNMAGTLLLAGLGRRKHLGDFLKMTGYPRFFVQNCLRHARLNGIWQGEEKGTNAPWANPETPDAEAFVSFIYDSLCLLGSAQRGG